MYHINPKHALQVTKSEKDKLADEIITSTYDITEDNISHKDLYKVSFKLVCNLVKTRSVFLHNGYGYITENDLRGVLTTIFKEHITKAMLVSLQLKQL